MIQLDNYNQVLLEKVNFWAFSVLLKLIPCILLTWLSLALIRILIDARKRKERLLGAKLINNNNVSKQQNNLLPGNNINICTDGNSVIVAGASLRQHRVSLTQPVANQQLSSSINQANGEAASKGQNNYVMQSEKCSNGGRSCF